MDPSIGVYVIDRFTYFTLEFLEGVTQNSKKTVYELVCSLEFYFKVILIVFFLNLSSTVVQLINAFQLFHIELIYSQEILEKYWLLN